MVDKKLVREVRAPEIDGDFYTHALHDLRSPLTVILGFACLDRRQTALDAGTGLHLENALKYTGAGGWVTVSGGENGAGWLVFAAEDTGPGMTSPDLDIALAPFGRIPETPAHGWPEAGLGINLAAGIMALHQGALSITCISGQGTKAESTLPKTRLNLHELVASPT